MEQYQATGQDLFNSIAQRYNSNPIMQYIIKLKEKINYEILEKAVKLSFIQEPILGCRFINDSIRPLWKYVDSKDTFSIFYKVSTEETQNAINDFLEKELSPEKGVQVLVCLICRANILRRN